MKLQLGRQQNHLSHKIRKSSERKKEKLCNVVLNKITLIAIVTVVYFGDIFISDPKQITISFLNRK